MKQLFAFIFIVLWVAACTDAPPPTDKNGFLLDREKAEFKGILLGKEVTITESDSTITNLNGKYGHGDGNGTYTAMGIGNVLAWADKKQWIGVQMYPINFYSHNNSPADSTYNQLKKINNLGVKGWSTQKIQWHILSQLDGKRVFEMYQILENESIEVIEVKEGATSTINVRDDYYPKTLWVTYKLKADAGELGTIDGTLKVRYNVTIPYGFTQIPLGF